MKRCIRFFRRLAVPLLFLLLHAPGAFGADFYEGVFTLAQTLEQNGAEQEAATEYKRYLFLQDYATGIHLSESYDALARFYQKNGDSALALEYVRLLKNCLDSTDTADARAVFAREIDLSLARANAEGASLQADIAFAPYLWLDDFSAQTRQYAWCAFLENCLQTENLDLFSHDFAYFCDQNPEVFSEDERQTVFAQLERYAAFKPKNPRAAGWLSLVPGLGQLYAHDPKDAANAFVLNGALIAASVYSLVHLHFWDFSLLELSPAIRFYRGNLYNAQKDAYAYNERTRAELKAPVLRILQDARRRISTL